MVIYQFGETFRKKKWYSNSVTEQVLFSFYAGTCEWKHFQLCDSHHKWFNK